MARSPADFVYRILANTSIEVVSGPPTAWSTKPTQMAHLQQHRAGQARRGNLEKWASTTVSLRGGKLENSSAHPDAGKVWSFGNYQQRLTDAVNYSNCPERRRHPTDQRHRRADADGRRGAGCELWMISAAARTRG